MGRYDGLLICSDFDGTLAEGGKIPQQNLEAIEEFQAKGGKFTLCTGRQPSALARLASELSTNAPCICLNGAMIYDRKRQELLYEESVTATAFYPCLREIAAAFPEGLTIAVYAVEERVGQHCSPDEQERLKQLFDHPIYKAVFYLPKEPVETEDARGRALLACVEQLAAGRYELSRSWATGVELQGLHYHKGKTARRLQRMLGADKLICVGDYENDLSMLREADLAFAVGNALDSVKAAADHILCNAKDGAIADLISRL